MSCNKKLFAWYMKEDQHNTGWADKSRKLGQWSSHAESTHTIDMICSKIDSSSWTPNKSLHISFVKCIANNGFMVGKKNYDELGDIELNVYTFMKMLSYSAASIEVIELYLFNNQSASDFFYSIIFDEYRYKLKAPLDVKNILRILIENSKHIKDLTFDIVDEYCVAIASLVQSSEDLKSLTLLDFNIGSNFTLDHMPSTLKHLSLIYGELNVQNFNINLNQLESLNLSLLNFKDLSFMNSAKNLVNLRIVSRDMIGINMNEWTCLETLEHLILEYCAACDSDFQFLNRCKQLKSVTLNAIEETEDDRFINGFLNLPAIEKLVLIRCYFKTLSQCNTLKWLHLEPVEWNIDEDFLTEVFTIMPNLRYLKVSQDTEETDEFTDQVYKLMKSVLLNSDLTFAMYRRTLNNYTNGEIVVVEKDPAKIDCNNFDFESTFFLDFFPNHDVFEPFKEALEEDHLNYHIRCVDRNSYVIPYLSNVSEIPVFKLKKTNENSPN